MRTVLLMGNPNVGKSAFFSRLTGVHVTTSNYAGTTVEYTKGYMLLSGERAAVVDVPGTYSLEPTCKAEEVACQMLSDARPGDVVINVVDATNLERNLYLTLELLEQDIPVIVALNMWDEAHHRGIHVDVERLSEWLGVPVVPTVAVTGEGFQHLAVEVKHARSPEVHSHTRKQRWIDIGEVIAEVQRLEHRHHTLAEKIQDLTVHPVSGLLIAALIACGAFIFIRFIAESMIAYVMEPLFEGYYSLLVLKVSALLGSSGFWHNVLVGKLFDGTIDYYQSFGLLTTGVFVPIAAVMPYIISFYLVLGVLEDSGYLPRLAVLLDSMLHRLGVHGFAIVPVLLGFGCNVPGILATRILESKRERFIAATLISIGVPCAALQAMIVGVLGKHGGVPVLIVYGCLFITGVTLGLLLNRLVPGFSPELLLEIPPYRLPPVSMVLKKLWWRVTGFLREALPVVLAGVFVVNILYYLKVFKIAAAASSPVISGMLGLPKEAVVAILIGFLRKDVAVGMLVPLGLDTGQLIVACVVLAMFFPCIATFVIMLRELGWSDMLKSVIIMVCTALLAGTLLNGVMQYAG